MEAVIHWPEQGCHITGVCLDRLRNSSRNSQATGKSSPILPPSARLRLAPLAAAINMMGTATSDKYNAPDVHQHFPTIIWHMIMKGVA